MCNGSSFLTCVYTANLWSICIKIECFIIQAFTVRNKVSNFEEITVTFKRVQPQISTFKKNTKIFKIYLFKKNDIISNYVRENMNRKNSVKMYILPCFKRFILTRVALIVKFLLVLFFLVIICNSTIFVTTCSHYFVSFFPQIFY